MALQASFVVNAIGGIAFITVAILLLALRPARSGAIGFAIFALTSGLQHLLGNLGELMGDAPWGPLLSLSRLPFLLIAPTALVWGAARFRHVNVWYAVGPFLALAVAGASALIVRPDLVAAPDGRSRVLGDLLFLDPYFLGIGVGSLLLLSQLRRETSEPLRQELQLLLAALLPVLAYTAAYSIAVLWRSWAFFTPLGANAYAVTFALSILATMGAALVLLRQTGRAPWLGAVTLALLAFGIIQGILVREWAQFGGVLRIGAAILLGYALLKFRVFDIDLRVKTGLARTLVGGLAIGAYFLASELAESIIADRTGSSLLGLAAAAGFVLLETRVMHAGRRIAERTLPRVDATDTYLETRKHTVYRAARESTSRDGVITERERRLLATLAKELGLEPEEVSRIERELDAVPA